MGNILRCFCGDDDGDDHYPYYYPSSRPHYQPQPQSPVRPQRQPLAPHGVTSANAGVTALAQDLLHFEVTSMVPEGLGRHVTSSKKAQVRWYRNILEAYKDAKPPPKTRAEAAKLVATALSRIQRIDLEGVLAFYGFPIVTIQVESSDHHSSLLPDGVQFVLNTLPVKANCVGDGDGFTAYVDTADLRESANVPLEVREAFIERAYARDCRDYKRAMQLQNTVVKAGYRVIGCDGEDILARKYRIRLRGIDAPEMDMEYGEESKNALVKLIAGKRAKIYVYDQDQFQRYVGDVYCDGVFIQEQMLKRGFAMHFKKYDKRPEFAKWENEASAALRGLWAHNPEKPWDWRRNQRNMIKHQTPAIQAC